MRTGDTDINQVLMYNLVSDDNEYHVVVTLTLCLERLYFSVLLTSQNSAIDTSHFQVLFCFFFTDFTSIR
jgi:hypothetical protein